MITVPLNLLSIPFILTIWALDSMLFLVVLRLALRKSARVQAMTIYQALKQLTDPLPLLVKRKLRQPEIEIDRPWLPWFLVVLTLLTSRYLLLGLLLALN